MLRVIGFLFVVGMIAGCRSQAPVYDPFLGSTTIAPPGTATQPSLPPYYTPAPGSAPTNMAPLGPSVTPGQPMSAPGPSPTYNAPVPGPSGYPTSSFTPNVSTPVANPNPTNPRYLPANATPASSPHMPSGHGAPPVYQPPGSAPSTPPANSPVAPAMNWQPAGRTSATPPATQASFTSPADGQPIRIAPPTGAAASPWTNSAAMSTTVPGGAVSSGTLNQNLHATSPPHLVPLSTVTGSTASGATGARPASFTTPSAAAATSGAYGYDPQYRWLKGKLEYSQSSRQWRLRYIPAENATDAYGGSVILADAGKLSGFQEGQFVQVHGALGPTGADQHSYAPLYHVGQIQPQ